MKTALTNLASTSWSETFGYKILVTLSSCLLIRMSDRNIGGMPTPKNRDIRVLIAGSHWLDPIVSEPVIVPPAIPVGATVEIPGVLRAFIMNERVPRNPKVPFAISEDVQLIATMGRVERTLPEFSGRVKIDIKYPLELDPPRYLDCIAPGGHITFSWTVSRINLLLSLRANFVTA
jgi:hypothetical protein